MVSMRPKPRPTRLEHRVLDLAGEQEGVISRRQLRELGGSNEWIARRRAIGWLVPVFRGVFAVGHPPRTRRGWYSAALAAGGDRSALSHRTAAAVHGMLPSSNQLHLTLPRTAEGLQGIRIHRPRTLRSDDVVHVDGLRVTSPARTLLDLADFRSRRLLERAIDQAEFHRLHLPLGEVNDRTRRRPRSRLLRAVIAEHVAGPTITESDAEELFLAIVQREGCRCRSRRSASGGAGRDAAFERDALRDAEVVVNGHRPLRFTRRAVKFDAGYVAETLRAVLD
jgi:hypothetical protein